MQGLHLGNSTAGLERVQDPHSSGLHLWPCYKARGCHLQLVLVFRFVEMLFRHSAAVTCFCWLLFIPFGAPPARSSPLADCSGSPAAPSDCGSTCTAESVLVCLCRPYRDTAVILAEVDLSHQNGAQITPTGAKVSSMLNKAGTNDFRVLD